MALTSSSKVAILLVSLLFTPFYQQKTVFCETDNNYFDSQQGDTHAVAYEEAKFQGASMQLLPRKWKGCYILSEEWRDRISSVDVIGGCVDLCMDTLCGGPCRKICPGMRGENNLTRINFDDNVSSFQKCICPYERLKGTIK